MTTHHPDDGPLDERGQIPGQMDVYEVLEEIERDDLPDLKAEAKRRPLTAKEVVALRLKGKQ